MLRLSAAPAAFGVAAAAAAGLALAAAASSWQVQAAVRTGSVAAQLDGAALAQPPSAPALGLALAAVQLAPVGGAVAIDVSKGNTFVVAMNASAAFGFANWPAAGRDQRVVVYCVQDAAGGRTASFAGVKWPDGAAPELSSAPGAVDCLVFDSFDGGATIYGNLVGGDYA
jgi:hypothetical protein